MSTGKILYPTLPYPDRIQFYTKWMPNIEGFFDFIKEYREITKCNMGGSKKTSYSHPTISKVLSVGIHDDRSSLPQRVSLSNFELGQPITSYGCIYRYKQKGKSPCYLLIKRKESMSYIDLIHGNYRESQLYFMLKEISEEERVRILNNTYDKLWEDLHLKPAEGNSYQYGKEVFEKIQPHLKE